MALRLTDSLYEDGNGRQASPMTPETVYEVLGRLGKLDGLSDEQREYTRTYLNELYFWNQKISRPYDYWFLVFQWWLETGGGTTDYWLRDGNPAGIGIWKDGVPSPWEGKLGAELAAKVHILELVYHTYPLPEVPAGFSDAYLADATHLDTVTRVRGNPNWPQNVNIINDLRTPVPPVDFVWAADQEYGVKIERLASQTGLQIPDAKGGTSMPVNIGNRPLRIAIGAGHRNTSGGNAFETALTAKATNEVVKLLRASKGFDVRCYTPNDGLGSFPGPLDAAAAQVRNWLYNEDWAADILHELHFEGTGTPSIRGAFVIYPDSAGLIGRNPGNIDIDVQAAGGEMGRLIAVSYGGVTRYGVPGRAMSERQTGVGADGFRLGVFGAWAEPYFINNSFQFISEGATYTNPEDLALMQRADFPAKHARGVVNAYVHIAKTRGNWTYPYQIGGTMPDIPTVPLAPDGQPYPDGLDAGIIGAAFGRFVGPGVGNDQFRYIFNPNGPISKAYYVHYKPSGRFPAVIHSFVDGSRWYIYYSDGNIQWRPNAGEPWRFTRKA